MRHNLIDTTIAHYQLLRHIARGGMADIYLARDIWTEQQVALKLVSNNDEYCARLRLEIEALATLHHEHILPVYEYGEHEGWCYLVMPYIEYGTLKDRLARGPLSPEEAGKLLAQLASALQYAHDQGIVHRDIKPSNVLLKDGSHVYLADFGLVKHVGFSTSLTLSGCLIGTPDYMAPELAEEEATPLSDLYALGVLLYQMLTGQVPFHGTSPINIFLKHLYEKPAALSLLNPSVPVAIERVVLHAMERNPWQRFTSVSELAQTYQLALINGLAALEEREILDPSQLQQPVVRARQPPKRRVNAWPLALVALTLLVCVAILPCLIAPLIGMQLQRALGSDIFGPIPYETTTTPTVSPIFPSRRAQQDQNSSLPGMDTDENNSLQTTSATPSATVATNKKAKDKEHAGRKPGKDSVKQ